MQDQMGLKQLVQNQRGKSNQEYYESYQVNPTRSTFSVSGKSYKEYCECIRQIQQGVLWAYQANPTKSTLSVSGKSYKEYFERIRQIQQRVLREYQENPTCSILRVSGKSGESHLKFHTLVWFVTSKILAKASRSAELCLMLPKYCKTFDSL